MELPKKKTPPTMNLASLRALFYGPEKIGKSTFCSHADNALFLPTEPGLGSLEVFQIPIASWEDLTKALALIEKGDHNFKTIIIDTADNAFNYCIQYICNEYDAKYPTDIPFGKGWGMIGLEFQRVLTKLFQLPYGVYLTSHTRVKKIESRTGDYDKTVPSLQERAAKVINGMVDMILFCDLEADKDDQGKQVIKRVLKTKPNPRFEAGDRTGKLPEVIDLDYQTFLKAFNQPTGKQ